MLKILLDENIPHQLVTLFREDVNVVTIAEKGWKGKENGELLSVAEKEFNIFITIDKGMPNQQNLAQFSIGFILLNAYSNRFEDLAPLMNEVNEKIARVSNGKLMNITL